jgi:hypothetical protein
MWQVNEARPTWLLKDAVRMGFVEIDGTGRRSSMMARSRVQAEIGLLV